MEKAGTMMRAAAVMLVFCLLAMGGRAEGKCVVKNQSSQPVVIVPAVAGVAVAVEVAVGATVVLPPSLQNCYVKNKKSGHQKGPVVLANGAIYVLVDALVIGEVNLCVATLVGGILNIGAVIVAAI